jgi:hypothetical protein
MLFLVLKNVLADPPYNTQGTPALRKALVATLPTLSLSDPLIVIDFIVYI